jgi:undecaprenyl-diphosphatase
LLYLNAFILAIIEGVTEFLPVSSTGHLIIAEQFFRLGTEQAGQSGFTADFLVIIQLPAILAVVVYFWKAIWPFQRPSDERRQVLLLWTKIAVACLPAAIFGLLLDDFIEERLFNPIVVAIALFVGGVLLIFIERRQSPPRVHSVHSVGYLMALGVGFFQCLAMIPGTSRSAATIIGAMVLGANRAAAAEFSFFLAIPTMFGATVLRVAKSGLAYSSQEWALLAIGSVVSFLTAWAVIAVFMRYIQRHDFVPFGYYRIILAIVVFVYFVFIANDRP